jgi:hypothetical protein
MESWADFTSESGRVEFRKDRSWQVDLTDYSLTIAGGGKVYTNGGDGADVGSEAERLACPKLPASWVLSQLICGPFNYPEDDPFTIVPDASFEGTPTFAIEFERHVDPPRTSTIPGFDATRPSAYILRFHIDRATGLPLAREEVLEQGGRPFGGSIARFKTSFVRRDSLPPSFLDPAATGYVPPEVIDMQTLDDPAVGVPVYWLGRGFDASSFGPLTLQTVEFRAPGVPGAGPGTRLGLRYIGSAGDIVTLEYWPPGAFESFAAELGNGFVWANCSDSRKLDVGGAAATIRVGYEPGQRIIPGAGNAPAPTATIPNACPTTPYDRFMAEVHYRDVVVTVNAPLSLVDEDGARFGQFDSEAALETLVRGLRLRAHGE